MNDSIEQPQSTEPATEARWFDSVADDGVKSWAANKNFKTPEDALKSYHSLEKLFGHDRAGNTVVIPKKEGATPEEIKQYREKLGIPDAPDGYKLAVPDGADDSFAKQAAQWFHKAGIPAEAATVLQQEYEGYAAAVQAEQQQVIQQKAEAEIADLQKQWGAAYNQNTETARRAAASFLPEEGKEQKLEALETALGTKGMLEFFHNIGKSLGEAQLVTGSASPILTPQEATAKITALGADKEFMSKLTNGDPDALKQYDTLIRASIGKIK